MSPSAPLSPEVAEAYGWCMDLARRHYENFPVASRLLPAPLRRPVAVIYAFARLADDIADEGCAPEAARLAALDRWGEKLELASAGTPVGEPLFVALADLFVHHPLPLTPFHHLLSAFRQDVEKRRYADFGELMDYCRRSANPVGELLLRLDGSASAENLLLSDRICSALQLINFWQDLAQDYDENDRIYLPREEMARFGVTEEQIGERRADPALRALLAFQYRRSRALLLDGAPLAGRVGGRMGWELRAIVAGGLRLLDRLEGTEPFARPRLSAPDWLRIAVKVLRYPRV